MRNLSPGRRSLPPRISRRLRAGRGWGGQGHPARNDSLLARGKEYGCSGCRISGGGYQILAIDLEGTEVCDWLTSRGITCVLLKYRVPGEGLVLDGGSPAELLQALEEWRPIHVEKWLSRETR
jgi:hypothetical protein